jgi:hypothetical protein
MVSGSTESILSRLHFSRSARRVARSFSAVLIVIASVFSDAADATPQQVDV